MFPGLMSLWKQRPSCRCCIADANPHVMLARVAQGRLAARSSFCKCDSRLPRSAYSKQSTVVSSLVAKPSRRMMLGWKVMRSSIIRSMSTLSVSPSPCFLDGFFAANLKGEAGSVSASMPWYTTAKAPLPSTLDCAQFSVQRATYSMSTFSMVSWRRRSRAVVKIDVCKLSSSARRSSGSSSSISSMPFGCSCRLSSNARFISGSLSSISMPFCGTSGESFSLGWRGCSGKSLQSSIGKLCSAPVSNRMQQ
mmetsp:Transcript_57186/g.133753  ORF Transcript_57186/g.133753 Transcript_57186/m.133753 type:complete len:251 (+) Transcript_57186:2053-2805(+)